MTKIVTLVIPSDNVMPRIHQDGEKKSCTFPYMLRVKAVPLSTYEIQFLLSALRWYSVEETSNNPTRSVIS